MHKEEYTDPSPYGIEDATLFEVRRYLGRTVFILGDLIQPDFEVDDETI